MIMTRSEGRASKQWASQTVCVIDPPLTSPAALVLLAKKYFSLDRSIYSEIRMTKIRRKWMKLQMKTPDSKGGLTCTLCGRKGLKPSSVDKNKLATLDHVIPIGIGGDWRDPNNFQVACYHCNVHKTTY